MAACAADPPPLCGTARARLVEAASAPHSLPRQHHRRGLAQIAHQDTRAGAGITRLRRQIRQPRGMLEQLRVVELQHDPHRFFVSRERRTLLAAVLTNPYSGTNDTCPSILDG